MIQLNRLVKDEDFWEQFLDSYYEHEDCFIGLLDHSDAKVRKNAVKLLGRVGDSTLADILFSHYENEETEFLKSDYLAALAEFDYKKYLPELKKRWKLLEGRERTKHSAEEIKQLQKLIWKAEPPKRHTFSGESMENKILLIVSGGHEPTVLKQLEKLPDTTAKAIKGGCMVTTKQLEKVRNIRTFQALLFDFYPFVIKSFDGDVIGKTLLNGGLTEYLCQRHKEKHTFLFRVDVKGVKDIAKKNQLARELSKCLEENSRGMFINEPSFYEVELRVIVGSNGSRVFLKLTCMPDERFSYRKYAMSTSMHPVKAALITQYMKPYMRPEANILDPFCGTGTLLIERAFAAPYKSIYGLDISGQAVQAAWENSQKAGHIMHLIQRNFNDFKHEYLFDEIITDMPRSSDRRIQSQMDYLYHLLFSRSRELLAPEGILAVYSEDSSLMEKWMVQNPWLRRLEKIPMTKDKTAWLYILQNHLTK
jgi:16S rRNA G966 N2-methylase RsmD